MTEGASGRGKEWRRKEGREREGKEGNVPACLLADLPCLLSCLLAPCLHVCACVRVFVRAAPNSRRRSQMIFWIRLEQFIFQRAPGKHVPGAGYPSGHSCGVAPPAHGPHPMIPLPFNPWQGVRRIIPIANVLEVCGSPWVADGRTMLME